MERPGRPFPPVPGVGVRDVTGTPSRRPIPAESPQAWRLRDTAWACHSVRGRPYARLTGRRTAGSPHTRLLVPAAAVGSQGLLSLGAGDVPADDLHRELARERPPVEVEPDEDVVELHGGPPARGRAARFPPPGGPPGRDPRRPAPGQGRPDGRSEGREPLEAAPRRRGIRRPTARTAGPRPGAGARPRRRRRGRSRPARARRPGETIGGWPVTGRPSTGGQAETPAGGRGLGGCGQKGGSSLNCPLLLAALLVRSGRAVAHLRLGPTSSASTSTTDRLSPSGVPGAALEAAVDDDPVAFGHRLGDVLGLLAPDVDPEERGVAVLPGVALTDPGGDGQPEVGHGVPVGGEPQLGVVGQVADDGDEGVHGALLGLGVLASPGGMVRQAGGQGVGATLWPESARLGGLPPVPCRPERWRSPGRRPPCLPPAKPVDWTPPWGAPCRPARPCDRAARTSTPRLEGCMLHRLQAGHGSRERLGTSRHMVLMLRLLEIPSVWQGAAQQRAGGRWRDR